VESASIVIKSFIDISIVALLSLFHPPRFLLYNYHHMPRPPLSYLPRFSGHYHLCVSALQPHP
jgi:hypothetical protein